MIAPIKNQIPEAIHVLIESCDSMYTHNKTEISGKIGNNGTLKPPLLLMSWRLRKGKTPKETNIKAIKVPMLTRFVN